MKATRWLLGSAALFIHFTTLAQDFDPPEVTIGERLFLETRFAQFFAANSGGDANATLAAGDPTVATTLTIGTPEPGPFAGQSMNCRVCHFVDEHNGTLGNRTYNDFARRSPIPPRTDGRTLTARNSPALVNASLRRAGGVLLHLDGEFTTGRELAAATLTGRNFGWLPAEHKEGVSHVAHIIRDDEGTGELAQAFGGSYRDVLLGTSAEVPGEFRLPAAYRIDVTSASDSQVVTAIARLIEAYMTSLTFAQGPGGAFAGSPYDVFLRKNHLPRAPLAGETPSAYAKRLLAATRALTEVQWVSNADRTFAIHTDQEFNFGPQELAGMKIFFTGPGARRASPVALATGGAANCVTCHSPPNFTDFSFHNTGATQEEYDSVHGADAFANLPIPALHERRTDPNASLPGSPQHPNATGNFAEAAHPAHPGRADLGLWNIFANPDKLHAQSRLLRLLTSGQAMTKASVLEQTIARFKTPGLRDLADSAPYLHNGSKDTIEDVIEFYRTFAEKARAGTLRNTAPELEGIALVPGDVPPLAAFLRALNEDYE